MIQNKKDRLSRLYIPKLISALGASVVIPSVQAVATTTLMDVNGTSERPFAATGISSPLVFEANVGQTSSGALFMARSSGYTLLVHEDGVSFEFLKPSLVNEVGMKTDRRKGFGIRFAGAACCSSPVGLDATGGVSNYPPETRTFSSETKTAQHFGKVLAKQIYPGIDVLYYGNERQLEYDFLIQPSTPLDQINLQLWGADTAWIDVDGNLSFSVGGIVVRQKKPYAYQESVPGVRRVVDVSYSATQGSGDTFQISLNVGEYDPSKALVIDPLIINYNFSRLIGVIGADSANAVAVDKLGNTYVAGYSTSTAGNTDAYVTKLGASGGVIYTTYLGGSGNDIANALAVDLFGNAVVAGVTNSSTFNGVSASGSMLYSQAFVTKLGASGTPQFTRILGGSSGDSATALALDSHGTIYVVGTTSSSDFLECTKNHSPCAGNLPHSLVSTSDAFIVKLGASGSTLLEAYLGASGGSASSISIDKADAPWIAGSASSVAASGTAFVTRVDPNGAGVGPRFFVGGITSSIGGGNPFIRGLAVGDSAINIAGYSVGSAFNTYTTNGFVAQIDKATGGVLYTTKFNSSGNSSVNGIAVDAIGRSYVVGNSNLGVPLVGASGGYGQSFAGGPEAFVAVLDTDSSVIYSSNLGSSGSDYGHAIALGSNSDFTVAGTTSASSFPITPGFSHTVSVSEGFVTRFSIQSVAGGLAVPITSGWQIVGNSVDTPISVANLLGDSSKVTSVWKWVSSGTATGISYPTWAFYSPVSSDGGRTYALSNGFEFLTTINGGEGFWVNAAVPFTLTLPPGNTISSTSFQKLQSGWGLISSGKVETPSAFNIDIGTTPPGAGTVPQNVSSLWAWDAVQSKWYFYSSVLEAQGGSALGDYIAAHGYLSFTTSGKTLGPGVGFWVYRP